MATFFVSLLSILVVAGICLLFGFHIVREDENAVVVRFGKPVRTVKSGSCWIIWPIERLRRFTTNIIELEFRETTIITKKSNPTKKSGEYGEANIKIKPTMYFRWPENKKCLITALRVVGNPEDKNSLKDLFEETVLDAFRSVGGNLTWKQISQDRKRFAQTVGKELENEKADPIKQACLQNVRLVIVNLELPEGLRNAITEPEIARFKKLATIRTAEGEKERLRQEGEGNRHKKEQEGEGDAYARQKLFAAIGKEPADLQKEILLTLREMAKGTSNTILFPIPSKLTDILEDVFGKEKGSIFDPAKFIAGLSESQKKSLTDWLGGKK